MAKSNSNARTFRPKKKLPIALETFKKINPEAQIEAVSTGFQIRSPWGDGSVGFDIGSNARSLLNIFGKIRLPVQFSAIWHMDSKDLEFIAGFISQKSKLIGTKFEFDFDGQKHTCEWAKSSPELPEIARALDPLGPSESNYRNLLGIRVGLNSPPSGRTLTSFWVRNISLSESKLSNFAKHLNFYMAHFDRDSSRVIIHELDAEPDDLFLIREPYGPTPSLITATKIDPYLLQVWETAQSSSIFQQYIHYYQMLEYAAFYNTHEDVLSQIKRIVKNPGALSDIDALSRKLRETMVQENAGEEIRMAHAIQRGVDPNTIWNEIEKRKDFFTQQTKFEGGLTIDAPCEKKNFDFGSFERGWASNLTNAFRDIRNGLVHARHKQQAHTLHPTSGNRKRLIPWLALISLAASQLTIYRAE